MLTRLLLFALLFLPLHCNAWLNSSLAPNTINISADNTRLIQVVGEMNERNELIAIVEGESRVFHIKHKIQKFGMWFNSAPITISDLGSYYQVFSSTPFLYNTFPIHDINKYKLDPVDFFNDARSKDTTKYLVIEKLRTLKLYSIKISEIEYIGDRFFRFYIHLPQRIPLGSYSIKLYSMGADDNLVLQREMRFSVIYDTQAIRMLNALSSHHLIYALSCVLLGVIMGVLYGVLFNKPLA